MSRIQLLILWVLALGAGIYHFGSKEKPDQIKNANLKIGSSIVNSDLIETASGFKIKSGDDEVTLKKVDEHWLVEEKDNFPATTDTISRVFNALREAKVAQSVIASPKYYDKFQLDSELEGEQKPDSITLKKGEKETATIFLGKTRQSTGGRGGNAGRFVRLASDDSGVYVVQENFAFLSSDPDSWIDKSLTPLEEGVIKMEITAPNDDNFNSWTVSRKTVQDDLLIENLTDKEETKTSETSSLKNIFASATFSELISAEDFQKRANTKASRQLKATDSAGSTFLITITPEKEEEEGKEKKDEKNKEDEKDNSSDTPTPVDYFVSISIENGPTKPEAVGEDASVQEKAVFAERVNNLSDLSESVNRMRKTYEGRYFLVSEATIGSLNKNRGELIQPKKEEKKPVSVATPPIRVPSPGDKTVNTPPLPGINTPPPSIARPKDTQNKPKIEAVTPPIQVPPIPNKPKGEETTPEPVEPAESEKDSPAE